MDGRRSHGLLLAGLTTLLTLGALRAFFSTIYFSNLSAMGIGASAGLALLVLSPVLYLLPIGRSRYLLPASALLLGLGRIAMGLVGDDASSYLAASALAVAGGMLLLPAAISAGAARDGALPIAAGIGAGLALDAALLALGRSVDPTVGTLGLVATVPAAAALVALAWRREGAAAPAMSATPQGRVLAAGVGFGALLFLEHAVLASPHHVARWNGLAVQPVALATVLGALVPLLLLARGWRPGGLTLAGLNAGALAFVLDHTFVHGPLLPLLVFVAQAALVWDAAALADVLARAGTAKAGRAFAAGALVTLVLHFVSAFALTFAYVPLSSVWKGSEQVIVPLAFLLVAIPAVRFAPLPAAAAPRRTVAWGALGLPALLVAAALLAPAADPAPPAAGEDVKVMAFNVHQGFSNAGVVDPAALERVLREESPDVVMLQESDTPRITSANVDVVTYLSERLGYHAAYGPPTSAESFGVGLLSRFPILEANVVPLPSTEDNRYFLEARLDVHGTDVWAYAVHLGLPAEDRMAQTTVLLDRAASRSGPRILAGDWNSCPTSACPEYEAGEDDVYPRMTAAFADARVAAGHPVDDEAGLTYEATRLHERIDYVFVSRDVQVVSQGTIRSPSALAASDHLPVVAVLSFA